MENAALKKELERAKTELWLLYEISNAMRTTLKLPEVLYIILTAVTSHDGLGFNRAMLFLMDEKEKILEGTMGIGPSDTQEADRIWTHIEKEELTLTKLIKRYHDLKKHVRESRLNSIIKNIKIPLQEKSGILAMTALEGMSFKLNAEDKAKDALLSQIGAYPCACVPLKGQHKVMGALLVDNSITKKEITKDDMRILGMIADQAGLAIENSMFYEQARQEANIDSLTKVWNHGYFQHLLKKMIQEKSDTNTKLSLAMMDMDNFKTYNDTLGHQKGDTFLKNTAYIFKAHLRKEDLLCRYGGEEFAVIMPDITKQEALYIVERLRKLIEKQFKNPSHKKPAAKVTLSSGIASFPEDGKTKSQLTAAADNALYKAKHTGKNKTCLA
ncbi:MAG: sensor domain-containing diguanylate cyclase [Candidatus Omnitrophica bacterium]|nr:sensor domain-containing diguanylate cyclase [Candidatus Omnitrophota bacterium]